MAPQVTIQLPRVRFETPSSQPTDPSEPTQPKDETTFFTPLVKKIIAFALVTFGIIAAAILYPPEFVVAVCMSACIILATLAVIKWAWDSIFNSPAPPPAPPSTTASIVSSTQPPPGETPTMRTTRLLREANTLQEQADARVGEAALANLDRSHPDPLLGPVIDLDGHGKPVVRRPTASDVFFPERPRSLSFSASPMMSPVDAHILPGHAQPSRQRASSQDAPPPPPEPKLEKTAPAPRSDIRSRAEEAERQCQQQTQEQHVAPGGRARASSSATNQPHIDIKQRGKELAPQLAAHMDPDVRAQYAPSSVEEHVAAGGRGGSSASTARPPAPPMAPPPPPQPPASSTSASNVQVGSRKPKT